MATVKMLKIVPKKCLMDEKVLITLKNLNAAQKITIRCEVVEKNFIYESYGHFIASLSGTVDLSSDPSFGGSYVGVDQMGLFWSMLPATGQKLGLRYIPLNVTEDKKFKLQIYDDFLTKDNFKRTIDLKLKTQQVIDPLEEGASIRCCCSPGVERNEIKHPTLRGTIFKPAGKGPFKGVIDIYGSAGGINEFRVALLASHGYIAYTLPHHRFKDLPDDLLDVSVEYFLEAINYFSSFDTVLPGIGLVGLSSGATLANFLSTLSSKITSVVSINGNSYLDFFLQYNNDVYPPTEDIIMNKNFCIPFKVHERGGILPNFVAYDERTVPLTFPLEKSNAKFLMVSGKDDLLLTGDLINQKFIKRLGKFDMVDKIKILSYPGAGHFIDPPFMPQTLLHYNPAYKDVVACGGEKDQNAAACLHSWKEILYFLHENTGMMKIISKL